MDEETLLGQLAEDCRLLVRAAQRAGWDTPAPMIDWDVRTVALHLGSVHRWSADIVRHARATNEQGGSRAFTPADLADADIPAWIDEGVDTLITTLRDAPADLVCFTFLRDVAPRPFWSRRQAHETAIHRVDVEAAAGGPVTAVPADFAQNGLDEIVEGFARMRPFAADRTAALAFAATDGPGRTITFGGERNVITPGARADADATVTADSDNLYRWAWNRPAEVAVAGDPSVLELWRRVRI